MRKNDPALSALQEDAVRYMLRPESDGAAMLALDMGLGKTRTGLMFAREYGARCILVVVPLQTMEDWEATAGREYPDLPVKVINSSATGVKAMGDFLFRTEGIYLITHQYWESKAWVPQLVAKRRKTDPDKYRKVDSGNWGGGGFLFIFDESHRTANAESWTHRAVMNLDPSVFKLAMSGTFMGDKFDGAYGATKWLWPHRTDILPRNIFEWRSMWADVVYDRFAPRNQKNNGEKNPGAFVSSLPCYIRMESDIPEAIPHDIKVTLYPEQRRIYDELDDKMVAWINEYPMVAEYDITKRIRQRQTTLAVPKISFELDEKTGVMNLEVDFDEDAPSAKVDALFREMDGRGELGDLMVDEPLLILTDSQKFAKLLTARLNQKYGDLAREWSGAVAHTQGKQARTKDRPFRKGIKQGFIDGHVKYIVGVQSAMGTGTDGLQYTDAKIVVFMSRADRRIDNEQGVARLNRKGQVQLVHMVSFIAEETIDTGQRSKQMDAAIKSAKIMRARVRREMKEAERERIAERKKVLGF